MDRWESGPFCSIVVLCGSSVALIALTPKSVVVFMLFFAITGVLGSGGGRSVMQNAFLPGLTTGEAWPWE